MSDRFPDIVVTDTCVLISSVMRALVLGLAHQQCFDVAWSTVIGKEWKRNAGRLWQVSDDDIAQQWNVLQTMFPQADLGDVSTFKEGLRYSDRKDHHVVAAGRAALARRPEAAVTILTRNIRDFNRSELRRHGLQLHDPDLFLWRCHQLWPTRMQPLLAGLPEQVASPERPELPLDALLRRERLFRLNKVVSCPL